MTTKTVTRPDVFYPLLLRKTETTTTVTRPDVLYDKTTADQHFGRDTETTTTLTRPDEFYNKSSADQHFVRNTLSPYSLVLFLLILLFLMIGSLFFLCLK